MVSLTRVVACALVLTLVSAIISCGGGSTATPAADSLGEATPAVETTTAAWPTGLPTDALQPWETLDSDGKVSAGLNADSEFLAGCEHFYDCTTGITDQDETVHIESGEPGSGLVAWAMYRVVMGGEQPGVVTADVNPGVNGDGEVSEYYIGLSDYGDGCWDWHGPFTDNHVRISTGADVRDGADYLSDLGNHFACIMAFDGATVDVVGVAANAYDETDTEAPPVPTSLHAFPAYGALDVYWDDVLAGDLAGYRLYWSEADFTSPDEAGVHSVDYLIGQGNYLLTGLPATTIRVRVSAVDISGNESALSDMVSVLVYEGNGPELNLGVSSSSGMINDTITLTATGATNYAWDLDGDGTYEVTGDTTGVQTADTGHTGVIRPSVRGTTDDESCVSCGAVSLVIASNTRPVASALADPATGTVPLLVTLTGTGLDNDGTLVSYSWDFDGDGVYDQIDAMDPGPVGHTYDTAGMYNAKFRVEDDLGAWDVDTVAILVSPAPDPANNPPVANLAIGTGEESGDAPHSVHFDASGSSDPDSGDGIVRYWWDFDGDGGFDQVTTTAVYAYTYQSGGSFSPAVMVEDGHGATDTASGPTVVVNAPPVARLEAGTLDILPGETVYLHGGASTDSDGSIVDYEWDLDGDGEYNDSDQEEGEQGDPSVALEIAAAGLYTVRLRVTDDDGATAVAEVDITAHGWAINEVGTAGICGGHCSLAIVNGNPAISFYENDADSLCYVQAADTLGATWNTPVRVDNDGTVGTYTSLVVVDGNPAIGYRDGGHANVKYARATDADGGTWGTPHTVDNYGSTGYYCSMAVVDGNPAISYYNATQGCLTYIRALDTTGATWDERVVVDDDGNVGKCCTMKVLNNRPAIAYCDDTSDDLMFVWADNGTGSAWRTPVTVTSAGNVGLQSHLEIFTNHPAISYLDYDNGYMMYVWSDSLNGSTWSTPVMVDGSGTIGTHSCLASIDGFPAVCYINNSAQDLYYAAAHDDEGATFDIPELVDDGGYAGLFPSMTEVVGQPAVAYHVQNTSTLKYARLY